MVTDEKSLQLVIQLNRLTSLGEIKWAIHQAPASITAGTDCVVPLYLETNHKGTRYGIYQIRSRAYDGERDTLYWNESVCLAVLDQDGRVLWDVSGVAPLWDLLSTVRGQIVNIDGLLNDLGANPGVIVKRRRFI
ncbi:hypothetical protein [Burkholderia sp. JKS000303]|uniref:hypothetical protein n=1 Tax=Burkholderia sp. JKS000303 TaxID=1938747 RepID=UPI000BF6859E|nr:hypothetical protein [Burkholderia sp. JKS000303]